VKLNNVEGSLFVTRKVFDKTTPCPHSRRCVYKKLIKASAKDLIRVVSFSLSKWYFFLQYADNTIFFMENDIDKARHPKMVLTCFDLVSHCY
jgi:hypothetical protein